MKETNPFNLSGYIGPELFCDRENETKQLIQNATNGVNTTLLSIRRMGKTGLLNHVFHKLQSKRNTHCIYIDIYATQSLKDFTNTLSTGVMHAFPEKQTIGKKFMQWIKGFRPIISFDQLTGQPEITLDFTQIQQYEQSLTGIFQFLEAQDKLIVIAIDEFQQITMYPEKNIEALLRTIIQRLKNIRLIFSGSNQHILSEIFHNSKRPFFSSTQFIHLKNINREVYINFIQSTFNKHKRKISKEALEFIVDFSRLHTYYTQVICNRLFSTGYNNITLKETQLICSKILKEQETIYFQYRNLITSMQWMLLKAIAKKDKVYQPTSKEFLKSNDVGTSANVQRALESLIQKEMIYKELDKEGSFYRVYDCFLARWLESNK